MLIEEAMGKRAYTGDVREEGEDYESEEATVESDLTISAA